VHVHDSTGSPPLLASWLQRYTIVPRRRLPFPMIPSAAPRDPEDRPKCARTGTWIDEPMLALTLGNDGQHAWAAVL
jgi:hypothetical protein